MLFLLSVVCAVAAFMCLSGVALMFAMRPDRSARGRYLLLGLLGWAWLATRDRGAVLVTVLPAAEILGMPGLRWLERLIGRVAGRNAARAGLAYALGVDYLRLSDKLRTHEQTVTRLTAQLAKGSAEAFDSAWLHLEVLGWGDAADAWLVQAIERGEVAGPLTPGVANNQACAYLRCGRPADGLALARQAVAGAPEHSGCRDTLGCILAGLGQLAEAEVQLSRALSLTNHKRASTRIALARVMAARGDFSGAAALADKALAYPGGAWSERGHSRETVRTWSAEWRAAAAAGGSEPVSGDWYPFARIPG